jgi:hypothetical protein
LRKALLAILLLICLLALHAPQAKALTIWQYPRPPEDGTTYATPINERMDSAYTDGKASVGLGVNIGSYYENWEPGHYPFYGNDGFSLRVVATGNSRKILDYGVSGDNYYWHDGLSNTLSLGDDAGAWLDVIAFKFRFYGGVGSAEYENVWVSSNGAIFFTDTCTSPYYSASIPTSTNPNCFVAPFWRDLKPNLGGSIKYGVAYHQPAGDDCLVISWNNVPDKNGNLQTFQVVLEQAKTSFMAFYVQSRIWFQYKSITLGDQTTVGIEDQEGYRGESYNYLTLTNGKALLLYQQSNYAAIGGLRIELVRNDMTYADIEICNDASSIRGVNVWLQSGAQPDPYARFAMALAGGAALLIPGYGGLIIGTVLWLPEMATTLAEMMKPNVVTIDDDRAHQINYASADSWEPNYNLIPVDALFGIEAWWIFTDANNNVEHYLSISAEISYQEFDYYGTPIGNPKTIATPHINIKTYTGTGGGGCPYVYVWNGQSYVIDNNLLPAAEDSMGADVEDYYRLGQLLVPAYQGTFYSAYSLQIRESEHEHDYFDQIKLLAVDHDSNVNVAVTPDGEILTYNNPVSPISAIDNYGVDTLSLLSAADGNHYQGHNGSYVTLTFAAADVSNGVKLVVREDGPVRKCPIYIQTLNETGDWNTVAVFYTRHYWTTDIINMTGYLPDTEGNLRVRLCFVDDDAIDYVGLDTSAQAEIETHNAYLVSAIHSEQGPVTLKLLFSDNIYAELLPGQQIQLSFIASTQQSQARTFIFYSEGHYYAITG